MLRSITPPGASVLDLCCFTGGFALSAAAGGAARVVGVDSSRPALDAAAVNAAANGLETACTWVKDDVAAWMRAAAAAGEAFDVVVLDPPKLAPNRKSLERGLRRYRSLNASAMRLVKPGGLLVREVVARGLLGGRRRGCGAAARPGHAGGVPVGLWPQATTPAPDATLQPPLRHR